MKNSIRIIVTVVALLGGGYGYLDKNQNINLSRIIQDVFGTSSQERGVTQSTSSDVTKVSAGSDFGHPRDMRRGRHPENFPHAKKLLARMYKEKEKTFYCGCKYSGKTIDFGSCGYSVRKRPNRAKRVEWEHVVPASLFGQQLQCWKKTKYTNSKGKISTRNGRKNCEKTSDIFRIMESDMHNLAPAVGEINGDRSNYKFGELPGEPRLYGSCDFEIDPKRRVAEPPDEVKGNIARIYFYMHNQYNMRMSDQQIKLFTAWSKEDPVDDAERARNEQIRKIQGNSNPYIE